MAASSSVSLAAMSVISASRLASRSVSSVSGHGQRRDVPGGRRLFFLERGDLHFDLGDLGARRFQVFLLDRQARPAALRCSPGRWYGLPRAPGAFLRTARSRAFSSCRSDARSALSVSSVLSRVAGARPISSLTEAQSFSRFTSSISMRWICCGELGLDPGVRRDRGFNGPASSLRARRSRV